MSATNPIVYPPIFINEYLSEKVGEIIPDRFAGSLRFFPTLPTDIDALTETFPEASNDVFTVYDRMFKMRRSAFPHIKCEQLLYYFYKMGEDPEALIETTQIVQDLLDDGDESAQDLNAWIATKVNSEGIAEFYSKNDAGIINPNATPYKFYPVYFHEIKIYQLEETRDIIDFGTARTYAGNKIIIDYEYHKPF